MIHIFLISGKARHGKDTFANLMQAYLRERFPKTPSFRFAFADEVKRVAYSMGWNGEKDDKGRKGLVFVGEGGREHFDPNVWINKVMGKIHEVFENTEDAFVFVTDCRYPNEVDLVKEAFDSLETPVHTFRIIRPFFDNGLPAEVKLDASETSLDNYLFDYFVTNSGNYEGFKLKVQRLTDIIFPTCKPVD